MKRPGAVVVPVASQEELGLLECVYPYKCGPIVAGDGWRRRRFVDEGRAIELTVAEMPMKPPDYAEWQRQARDYPAARILLPRASGFFTCAGRGATERCDLHVQSEEGLHVEMSGNSRATRADLENLFDLLNWK